MAVVHTWTSRTLDAEELADLYEWLDRVPLSKPRNNVEKDFADGILAAEIVRFYYPDIVDFRMLRPALNLQERTEQWKLLNSEVFDRIGLTVPSHVLTQLCISKSGIAQSFLFNLRMSLALTGAQTNLFPPPQFLQDPRLNDPKTQTGHGLAYPIHPHAHVNPYHHMYNPLWMNPKGLPYLYPPEEGGKTPRSSTNGTDRTPKDKSGQPMHSPSTKSFASTTNGDRPTRGGGKGALPPVKEPFVPMPMANASVSLAQAKSDLNEKSKKLQEKEEEVIELKEKMKRMDQMVQSKNSKIQELTDQIEKMNKTKNNSTSKSGK